MGLALRVELVRYAVVCWNDYVGRTLDAFEVLLPPRIFFNDGHCVAPGSELGNLLV